MSTTALPVPPVFNPLMWPLTDDKVVHTFSGAIADFTQVNSLLVADETNSMITIMGKTVKALNLQLETQDADENFPIYLEVSGQKYHYVICIWQDRFGIQVWDHAAINATTFKVTHRPNFTSVSTIESVLRDIANDLP